MGFRVCDSCEFPFISFGFNKCSSCELEERQEKELKNARKLEDKKVDSVSGGSSENLQDLPKEADEK